MAEFMAPGCAVTAPRMHFISGLPRSGSTLLAALLRQNPRFHAGMSSPLCALFTSLLNGMSAEGSGFISDQQRSRVLRGLSESYFAEHSSRAAVFDTNRMWTARLPALARLDANVKLICMVRNVAWIMDSIERLVRGNALLPSKLFGDGERANVYTRLDALSSRDRLVGAAWTALKGAFYGSDAEHLLVIEYDYLAKAPGRVMELVYRFLGEDAFVHDFENVEYDEPEFDARLSTPGLHRVARTVSFTERASILPPDLFARFDRMSFWTDQAPSGAHLVAPRRPRAVAA
jgi:sulfotransferase